MKKKAELGDEDTWVCLSARPITSYANVGAIFALWDSSFLLCKMRRPEIRYPTLVSATSHFFYFWMIGMGNKQDTETELGWDRNTFVRSQTGQAD